MPTLVEVQLEISQHDGHGPKMYWAFLDADGNVVFNFLCTIIGSMWAVANLSDIISDRVMIAPGDELPELGSPYVRTEFEDDTFGRHIGGYTNKETDTYVVTDNEAGNSFKINIPTGSTLVEAMIKITQFPPGTKPKSDTLDVSNPQDWPSGLPSDTTDALNILAARLKVLEG